MPVTLYDKQGNPVPIPEDQLETAFKSGQYTADQNTKIPVVLDDGRTGYVPPASFEQALQQGAKVATPDQVEAHETEKAQAALQAQYGNLGHAALTYGQNALDTATFGLSTDAIGAVGGQSTRRAMREMNEANPNAAFAGQVTGIVAPIAADFLTEGAATPLLAEDLARLGEGGAETAKAAASLSKRALLAPQHALGYVGDQTEVALAKMLGPEATSQLGKLAQQAVLKAGRMGTEGTLVGASQYLKEEMLQDNPELSGEKLYHSMLQGGELGLGLGAALPLAKAGFRGAGVLGADALGAIGRRFGIDSEEQAIKAIDHTGLIDKTLKEDPEALPGGTRYGKSALRRRLLDDGAVAPVDSLSDIVPKIDAGAAKATGDLTQAYNKLDEIQAPILSQLAEKPIGFGPRIADVADVLDNIVPKEEKFVKADPSFKDVANWKAELMDSAVKAKPVEPIPRTQKEIQDFINSPEGRSWAKENPDAFSRWVNGDASAIPPKVPLPPEPAAVTGNLQFKEATNLLSQIQNKVDTVTEPEIRKIWVDARNKLDNLIAGDAEKAASLPDRVKAAFLKNAGDTPANKELLENYERQIETSKADIASKRVAFKQYSIASDAAHASLEKVRAPRAPLFSAAHAGEAAAAYGIHAAPHLLGAASGIAVPAVAAHLGIRAAKQIVAKYGRSTAAVILDKIETFGAIQRANRLIDAKINRGLERTFNEEAEKIRPKRLPVSDYNKAVDWVNERVRNSELHMQHIDSLASPFMKNAPRTAAAFQKAGLQSLIYLYSQIPKEPPSRGNSLTPQLNKWEPSDQQKSQFLRQVQVAQDPVLTLTHAIAEGTLTAAEVQTAHATSPELTQHLVHRIGTELEKLTKPLPMKTEMSLKTMLQKPQLDPGLMQLISQPLNIPQPPAPKGQGGRHGKLSKVADFTGTGNQDKY